MGFVWSNKEDQSILTLFEYDPADLSTSVKESKIFQTDPDFEDNYQFILTEEGLGRILYVDLTGELQIIKISGEDGIVEVDKSVQLQGIENMKPVRFSAFGSYIALSYENEKVLVYDIENNKMKYSLTPDPNQKEIGQRVLKLGSIINTAPVHFKLVYSTRNTENLSQLSINEIHFYDDMPEPQIHKNLQMSDLDDPSND